jgi:uncharacterized membrane protein
MILVVCATIGVGLMSGLYWSFAIAVMPGLKDADDRVFVSVMQTINRRIQNVWFISLFLASVLLPVATAVTLLVSGDAETRASGIAGAVLAILPFAITVAGNIPLNNTLESVGDSGEIKDPATVRWTYEGPWTRLNLWRTVSSTLAFVVLVGGQVA